MFIGALLIIVGGVFFLKNSGVLSNNVWGIIWPLALVAFGVYLIYKQHRLRVWKEKIWRKLE